MKIKEIYGDFDMDEDTKSCIAESKVTVEEAKKIFGGSRTASRNGQVLRFFKPLHILNFFLYNFSALSGVCLRSKFAVNQICF